MKVTVKGARLTNGDVQFLSLVERGANRTPFKIQKGARDMINLDLSRAFKRSKEGETGIVGFVIAKADQTPELEAALKAAGVKVDAPVVDGEIVIYKQGEDDPKADSNVAVRLDDQFMVVCKGFDPNALAGDSTFGEILKSHGFMPGFSMASEALYAGIRNSMLSSDTPDAAVAKLEDQLAEYNDYVLGLAKAVPAAAFKAQDAFHAAKEDAIVKAMKKPADVSDDDWSKMDMAGKQAACAKAKKADDDAAAAKAIADAAEAARVAAEEAAKAGAKKVEKTEADPKEPAKNEVTTEERVAQLVAKALESVGPQITEALKPITAAVTELKTQVATVAKTAGEAKDAAAAVTELLDGIAVTTDGGGDPEQTEKAEEVGSLGIIDTGFQRGIRKSDKQRHDARRSRHVL